MTKTSAKKNARALLCLQNRSECHYCGKKTTFAKSTLDHVIPLSNGGTDAWSNLVFACKQCNSKKGNKSHKLFVAEKLKEFEAFLRAPAFQKYLRGAK